MSEVQCTISVDEYNKLRNRIAELEANELELKRQVEDARLGEHDSEARMMHQLFGQAFTIVKFAVANLPVLAVRGWPYAELREIAKALPTIPMMNDYDREISTDLRLFADEAAQWEGFRAQGIEQQMLRQDNLSRQARVASGGNPGGNFGTTLIDNQRESSSLAAAQSFERMTAPWNRDKKKPRTRVTTAKPRRRIKSGGRK